MGVVQFDTTRNRFLAAGDEFLIKIWDMDNTGLLTTIDADGGLPASPRIRFNKEGTLLAVSTLDNGIKILANADGLRLLRTLENRSFDASRNAAETVTKPLINPLTAAANAAAASSSGTPAPAAITAMVCIYALSHFS
jgi:WD40 repeat protein